MISEKELSEKALEARVRRRLAKSGMELCKSRSRKMKSELGKYCIVDWPCFLLWDNVNLLVAALYLDAASPVEIAHLAGLEGL